MGKIYENNHFFKDKLDLINYIEDLYQCRDVHSLTEKVLHDLKEAVNPNAGTFYMVNEDRNLSFTSVFNDKLLRENDQSIMYYADITLPIDKKSMVGYVGTTLKAINIPDVQMLTGEEEYEFNNSFDIKTGYETKSMLIFPVLTRDQDLLGVIQLINRQDDNGKVVPFSPDDEALCKDYLYSISLFMSNLLEQYYNVIRMIKIAELRDPTETGLHVKRVGSVAAELYHAYQKAQGIPYADIKRPKEMIRVAAMFHDIGKIGILDSILKKPGRLTPEERAIMSGHSEFGWSIFTGSKSPLDQLAATIAYHHHQRFDGKGYPAVQIGNAYRPLAGEEIPLEARIVAIADVYDSLRSKRVYKSDMSLDMTKKILEENSGTHFDSKILEVFLSIIDIAEAIRIKYSESYPI